MTDRAYVDAVLKWRHERETSLRRENGWLALAGLFWLKPGRNSAGSDPSGDIILPARLPPLVGHFDHDAASVNWVLAPTLGPPELPHYPASRTLQTDVSGDPTFLDFEGTRMVVIDRGGRLAVRVWDNLRPERSRFAPRTWFEINPDFRIPAQYTAYAQQKTASVPDFAGSSLDLPIDGYIEFEFAGVARRLEATREDDGSFFIRFWDTTALDETYPSGRYLVATFDDPAATVLDFNYAYSPPCAFTPFATCVFAPAGNRLDFRVEAGETYERR